MSRAGEGLRYSSQQRRLATCHGQLGGEEVHVDGDCLLLDAALVVARFAGHIGVQVRPANSELQSLLSVYKWSEDNCILQ